MTCIFSLFFSVWAVISYQSAVSSDILTSSHHYPLAVIQWQFQSVLSLRSTRGIQRRQIPNWPRLEQLAKFESLLQARPGRLIIYIYRGIAIQVIVCSLHFGKYNFSQILDIIQLFISTVDSLSISIWPRGSERCTPVNMAFWNCNVDSPLMIRDPPRNGKATGGCCI